MVYLYGGWCSRMVNGVPAWWNVGRILEIVFDRLLNYLIEVSEASVEELFLYSLLSRCFW